MKRGRPRISDRSKVVKDKTIHVALSPEQYRKMATMAAEDRRALTEWVRLLIEDEWNRRQQHTPAAPAA